MTGVRNAQQDIDVDLTQLILSLWRNRVRIALVVIAATAIAFVFASAITPKYAAETRILIETRESVFTRPNSNGESERPVLDEEGVTSQVQVISSTDLLKKVAADLKLAERDEFEASGNLSALGRTLVLLGLKSDPGEVPPEERVLKAFREKLTVFRVEKSRVIVIEFSSEDPALAAAVPNALAAAFIAGQRDAKLQSNAAATDWLEPEIADLRERVRDAEQKVADYRSSSDLLVGQNNSVLATQQLSELSSELSRVRANRAAAEATAEGVRAALKAGASVETLPSVLSSPLIQRLRERQVQLKADIADLSATLLGNHPRIRSLNSQLADLENQIRADAQKVLQGLENEAKTAGFRERQLDADLNALKAQSSRAGEQEVELRALEREAASQRDLLESYLSRFREASSRRDGNYSPVDARIFSQAIPPSEAYYPKKIPIALAAFAGSLLIMTIVTLLSELFSGRAMRAAPGARVDPVEEVAMKPATESATGAFRPAGFTAASPSLKSASKDLSSDPVETVSRSAETESIERVTEKIVSSGVSRAVFVSPAGDQAAASAVMVARASADAGLRVLLLDLTMSAAASKPMLDTARLSGITNLLAAEAQFRDVIHVDLYSECHVIPTGTADPALAMRAAERLPIILTSLAAAYDLLVIECGAAEASSIARLLSDDAELFVSAIEADAALVDATRDDLRQRATRAATIVSPDVGEEPLRPQPSRSAA